ncbi:MAG: multicopper oxidase family protein [Betaproteobacteria bacterium]|nr:multicopper oxidase family protein [Betaproteobacteria bacterium]
MHRRRFLQAAAAGSISALAPVRDASAQMAGMPGSGKGGGMMGQWAYAKATWQTGLPLRRIPALANGSPLPGTFEGTLVASPYSASLIPDHATDLWGYNDSYPGPLIEVYEGQHVDIEFTNRLGIDSTIHWHGLAVPADQDGSPMDPVRPGATRHYNFEVPPGSAGTYWYHPHAHLTNTLQVGRGLAAPLIVRGADDPLRMLPELTLLVTSLAVDGDGRVFAGAVARPGMPVMMMGGVGELLVNGQKHPVHATTPGATERWRVINATPGHYLRLQLDGHRFAVVGTDGGLLSEPLPGLTEWVLAPAQRVEIVVTVATQPSARFWLRDLGQGGWMGTGAGAALMAIETGAGPAQPRVDVPAYLRPIADIGPASARQQIVLSMSGMGASGRFLINGRSFDMNRVDLETVVGRVELWDLINTTYMDHPIHVHGTQFQVVGRTVRGLAAPIPYVAWLDTVNVPAGETVTINIRQPLPGKRMFHCHILPHEDAGMMAVLNAFAV